LPPVHDSIERGHDAVIRHLVLLAEQGKLLGLDPVKLLRGTHDVADDRAVHVSLQDLRAASAAGDFEE
jgi:hypothetical protein